MKKVLIVVDMQNDFITGTLGSKEAVAIVENVKNRIAYLLENGFDEVFFTRDTHTNNYMNTLEGKYLPVLHCVAGTEGWEIIPELTEFINYFDKWERTIVVNKGTFGFNEWKSFLGESDDIEIELMGVCTDICVVSNALILRMLYPNSKITVNANCCAGVTPEKHKAALEVMKSCQIEVVEE